MIVDKYGNISMTRGDTEFMDVVMIDKPTGNLLKFEEGDTVYFSVKRTVNDFEYIIQKKIVDFEDGIAKVIISHEDTRYLEYGRYVYDVQVTDKNGIVSTIVRPSIFEIATEVTYEK